jgi:hypothetical protein
LAGEVFRKALLLRQSNVGNWVANPVAHIEDLDLVIWRAAPGKVLSDSYGGEEEYCRGLCLAGKGLRQFHDAYLLQPRLFSGSQTRTLQDELKLARRYLDLVELLLRNKLSDLAQCLAELEKCVDFMGGFNRRSLHRDYHDNQILLDEEHAVILDLDQVGEGDPAIDVGNFLAHIDFRLAYHHSAEDVTPYAEEFLSAYGVSPGSALRRRVAFAHAVSLLRNCCLYVFLPGRLQALTDACRRTIHTLHE